MDDKNTFNRKPLVAAVATACAAMAGPAPAQDAGEAQIEEILVTATRRATSVTDIPYNISAMTGDSLDTLQAMYGITVVDRGYRNGGMVNSIVIRGLNVDNGQNGDIMLNAVPTVATYYDNSPMYANFLVKDVERVEVLRGPQGTLYGSGSLGGTVRYITRTPSTEGFESDIELDYGQTAGSDGNNLAADVMVNVPMGDIAALRVNYSHIDNDGSIDYVNAYQLNEFREPLVMLRGSKRCRHGRDRLCSRRRSRRALRQLLGPTDLPLPGRHHRRPPFDDTG
jgi:outer membrane receptor protein involved in Fe transport